MEKYRKNSILFNLNRFKIGDGEEHGDFLLISQTKLRKDITCNNFACKKGEGQNREKLFSFTKKRIMRKGEIVIIYGFTTRRDRFTGKANKVCGWECLKKSLNTKSYFDANMQYVLEETLNKRREEEYGI